MSAKTERRVVWLIRRIIKQRAAWSGYGNDLDHYVGNVWGMNLYLYISGRDHYELAKACAALAKRKRNER